MNFDPSAFVADQELIQGLEKQTVPVFCSEERTLFRQGEDPAGLYILKSGEATLTMNSPAGKEVVSIQAAPGSLLGLPALIGNEPYTLTAVAKAGTRLGFLTRDSFTDLVSASPLLSLKILQVLAAEVRSARSAILRQRPAQAPRRSRLTPARLP
jgi:CRP/FNR family transcriptional regulator